MNAEIGLPKIDCARD